MPDFEDSIQSVAASYNEIEIIITRNTIDFKNSSVKAMNLTEYLNQFKRKK